VLEQKYKAALEENKRIRHGSRLSSSQLSVDLECVHQQERVLTSMRNIVWFAEALFEGQNGTKTTPWIINYQMNKHRSYEKARKTLTPAKPYSGTLE